MKTILVILFMFPAIMTKAQSAAADTVANRMAQKMKDSLSLTDTQQQQVYQVNLQLHLLKMSRRQQYAGTDSLRYHIQRVENMRDSLYRIIISDEKYQLYLEKKRNIINNN